MKRKIWTPVAFYKDFGHEENDIVNCFDGSTKEKFSVGQFWRGFQNVAGIYVLVIFIELGFGIGIYLLILENRTSVKHLTR